MDLDTIFAVLTGADRAAKESDPFRPMADFTKQLGQAVVQASPSGSTEENILAGILTGLAGGASENLSQGYLSKQSDLSNTLLLDGLKSGVLPERPEGMSRSVFDNLGRANSVFKVNNQLENQESDRAVKNKLLEKLVDTQIDADPRKRRAGEDFMRRMGMIQGDAAPSAPLATNKPQTSDLFPGGPESVKTKFSRTFDDFLAQGATPNAALDAANSLTAAERKANTGSVDTVAEARKKAQALLDLASTAEAGVEGAGNTGGFGWPVKDFASKLYATISPEETQQRAAQTLLDSVKPDIIKATRTAGVGAMSDVEMRAYLSAGPNSANTPTENALLIDKLRNAGKWEQEYADFLDTYREEKGTTQGADKLWQQYKAAHPLFVDGKPNMERPSWMEFFTGGQGPVIDAPPSAAPQTKVVGGVTFVKVPGGWEAQ